MPNAYHSVSFTVRDSISDDEVIERFRRFDGRPGLDRFLKESLAEIHAVNLMDLLPQPLKIMVHDHVDQLA